MEPGATTAGPPRRPWLFWPVLVLALVAIVGGAVVAISSYARTGGPDGAVRGYFEALQRGDAATALGFGDVPAGPRTLLTSAVLREQQRVAPIVDLTVGPVQRSGSRADVRVSYALRYPAGDSVVRVGIAVHESGGTWRLDAAVVPTRLLLRTAQQRASVLGRELPAGTVLAFPGAPPIRFDTSYLALNPDIGIVPGSTAVRVYTATVTAAGRSAMQDAVVTAVGRCVAAARPAVSCPLPSGRYVPGSVRGTLAGEPSDVSVSLDATDVGRFELTGEIPVQATSFRRLDFRDRVISGRGRLTLVVRAVAAAHAPLTVSWLSP